MARFLSEKPQFPPSPSLFKLPVTLSASSVLLSEVYPTSYTYTNILHGVIEEQIFSIIARVRVRPDSIVLFFLHISIQNKFNMGLVKIQLTGKWPHM